MWLLDTFDTYASVVAVEVVGTTGCVKQGDKQLIRKKSIQPLHKQQDIVHHIGHTRSFSPHLATIKVFICNGCILHKQKKSFAKKLRVGNSVCVVVARYRQNNGMIICIFIPPNTNWEGPGFFLSNTKLIDYYINFSF